MATPTELFINSELPKRPYTNQFPLTAGHVPVATGTGLQVEARALTTSDISGMSSYATQGDLSNVLAGLWDDRGAYTVNAAGNINYPSSAGSGVAGALMKGDIFTVAGAVADVSTINNIAVNNGDTVRALVDNPSATDNAHWAIAENNIGYVPENRANKTTNTDLSGATGTYPDTPTVKSYIDNYDISAASISSTGTVTLTRTASNLTFQVPTAISGLSFDANTGVLTSSYTNNATSTTITVAANEVSDNVFRIKDNTDATKKIAFEASGITAGQTRTITMPDVDVDLGQVGSLNSIRITPIDSGNITLQSNKLYLTLVPSDGVSSFTFTLPSTPVNGDAIEIHDSIGAFSGTTTLIFKANKNFTFPIGVTGSVSGSAPNIEWTDTRRATAKRWKFTYFSYLSGFWRVEEFDAGGCRSPELSAMRKANSSVGVVHNIDAVSGTNKTITYPNRDVDLGLVGNSDFADTAFRISDNTDSTKKIAFEASGIATGQTRTITMPDVDVDLGAIGVTKVYTAGVPYRIGELVYHQNKTWRVLIAHTGAIPFVNGNLSLVGDVLDVTLLAGSTYTAQRLGALVPYLNAVDKTLVITITVASDVTIDISEAPLKVIILNRYPSLNKKVTITKTHASNAVQFLNDSGVDITTTAVGLTSTYDINLAPGGELEITSSGDYQVVVSLRKQNAIGRFKLSDPSGTLYADRNSGWLFNGSATDARTITLPNANVNLGKVAQAASTSTDGYLTSADWNTFNGKLSPSDLRYNFISYTSSVPYTIPASAVTEGGRTIIELSSSLLTNIYVANTTSAAKSIGDSVHVSVTGAITAPVTLGGSGATLEGDPIFSFQYQTKTLIYKGSNVWKIIG